MKFGVVTFPGSNCDDDCINVTNNIFNIPTDRLWHKDSRDLSTYDCIILPGGFSYGDYLRPGGIAKFSPIIQKVKEYADKGGLVFGICNGFQILVETGLLDGVLLRNSSLKFICKNVYLKLENSNTPFTNSCKSVMKIPIAHKDGSFYCESDTLKKLEDNNQVIFRYCNQKGIVDSESNPNGSINSIAGICNKNKNVFGMMPHPERCSEDILGNSDGKLIFTSIINFLSK